MGLLAKPVEMNPGKDGGGARQLGYFPDSTVERINTIQRLKREGGLMSDIVNQLKDEGGATVAPKLVPQEVEPATVSYLAARSSDGAALHVSIDQIPHPADMINYNFEVVWYNDAARGEILGGFEVLPPDSKNRGILQLICHSAAIANKNTELPGFHMALAKGRLSASAFARACKELPAE